MYVIQYVYEFIGVFYYEIQFKKNPSMKQTERLLIYVYN